MSLLSILPIGDGCVLDRYELEGSSGGVHRGVPQLLRHHLPQALEALQLDRWRFRQFAHGAVALLL